MELTRISVMRPDKKTKEAIIAVLKIIGEAFAVFAVFAMLYALLIIGYAIGLPM